MEKDSVAVMEMAMIKRLNEYLHCIDIIIENHSSEEYSRQIVVSGQLEMMHTMIDSDREKLEKQQF